MSQENKERKFSISNIIFTAIFTIAFITQYILMILSYNALGWIFSLYMGWIIWPFSLYFGFITFRVFKKKGGVEKGTSYTQTTTLVERGPYALVRHPQYLAFVLFSISITLWAQTLVSLFLTGTIIILTYRWTYREESHLIIKFGTSYINYQKRVTRLNPIIGLIKYALRKEKKPNSVSSNENYDTP